MILCIVIIVLLLLAYNKSRFITNPSFKDKYEKKMMVYYVLVLSLLAALKFIVPGTDAEGYWGTYVNMPNYTFDYLYETFHDWWAYYFICKVFSLSGLPPHFWFGFLEAFYFGAVMLFIKKFSKDKLYSVLLSFTIGYFDFTFSGSKQTLAMGFALFSFVLFHDRKYLWSVLLMLIAYHCHHTSIISVAGFLLLQFWDMKSYWQIVVTGALTVILGGQYFITRALMMMDSEHYSEIYLGNESQYSLVVFFYLVLYVVIAYVLGSGYRKSDKKYSRLFFGGSFLCVVAQSMAQISADFFRLAYYFFPFMMVLVPNALDGANVRNKKQIKVIFAALTMFFLLYTSRDYNYLFMWQK